MTLTILVLQWNSTFKQISQNELFFLSLYIKVRPQFSPQGTARNSDSHVSCCQVVKNVDAYLLVWKKFEFLMGLKNTVERTLLRQLSVGHMWTHFFFDGLSYNFACTWGLLFKV